jgi:hypothetical protein
MEKMNNASDGYLQHDLSRSMPGCIAAAGTRNSSRESRLRIDFTNIKIDQRFRPQLSENGPATFFS